MGRGVAKEAALRFPHLPRMLGVVILCGWHRPFAFHNLKIIAFPVKRQWWEKADLELIDSSARLLPLLADELGEKQIFMVRPGCGNGRLSWKQVKPILERNLDERFVIVEKEG